MEMLNGDRAATPLVIALGKLRIGHERNAIERYGHALNAIGRGHKTRRLQKRNDGNIVGDDVFGLAVERSTARRVGSRTRLADLFVERRG